MITDVLDNAKLYSGLATGISAGLDYLAGVDLKTLSAGRHDIEGDKVYALVQDYLTKPLEQGLWEAHRRYIDIQFIVSGRELIGYAHIGEMSVSVDYSTEKDCALFSGEGSFLTARPGTFFVFFPDDCHKPSIAVSDPEQVRKVVVKVASG